MQTKVLYKTRHDSESNDEAQTGHETVYQTRASRACRRCDFSGGRIEWLWLLHTRRCSLLERVRLVGTVTKSFTTVLTKDAPPEGPLLPSLTKLSLFNTLHIVDTSGDVPYT
jgi:hypothetical protein